MKKSQLVSLLFLGMLPAGVCHAAEIAPGMFIGASMPIAQDDSGTGLHYGIRVPVRIHSALVVEPFYAASNLGSVTDVIAGFEYTREGLDLHAFGLNVGPRIADLLPHTSLVPYVGLGWHRLSRVASETTTDSGYNFGVAIQLALPSQVDVDLRGEFNMIVTGSTTRKATNVSLGLGVRFWNPFLEG